MHGSVYEVRVDGVVQSEEMAGLGGFVVEPESRGAVLRGYVSDPAALYGLVLQLELLGLRLTEIRRLEHDPVAGLLG